MLHNPPDRQKLSIFELIQVAADDDDFDMSRRRDALEVGCVGRARLASTSRVGTAQTEGLNGRPHTHTQTSTHVPNYRR